MTRVIKFRAWDDKEKVMIPNIGLAGLTNWEGVNFYEWMQFTGLTDKNGKEIYEGDVVKISSYNNRKWEVRWNSHMPGYWLIAKNGSTHGALHQAEHYVEIIGNIYENSDLLV